VEAYRSEDGHGIRIIRPCGPYFNWAWQKLHKVSVSTKAVDLTWDPTKSQETIEVVTHYSARVEAQCGVEAWLFAWSPLLSV
jgi:hypothetical protein